MLVALFVAFVVLRKQGAHSVTVIEAVNWFLIWVALSFAFNAHFWWAVYQDHGTAAGKEPDMNNNPALKLLRKVLPVSKNSDGEKFFTFENGKRITTPLLMVIALVGLTDGIFAVDSIPAIFAITSDPFMVLTRNIVAILVFVGTKVLLIDVIKIPVLLSLCVLMAVLTLTLVWSVRTAPKLPRLHNTKTS